MSAFISLSRLSWSTPDGRPVLSDLTLRFEPERTGLVGRNGVGKSTLFGLIAGTLRPQSGTVTVSGRLGWLRQSAQLAGDETVADLFGVREALALLGRAEAGRAGADELAEADWTLPERIAASLARAGLDAVPATALASLSGGQRTRAALAAMTFADPDFLLLDEPTNNLDRDGRVAVRDLLAGWRKGAVVISHDRELLDSMDAIVELTSLGATRFGGNWTHYRAAKAVLLAAAESDLAHAEKQVSEQAGEAQRRRERQARRDGAGRKMGAKGDMPRIVAGLRKDRSEDTGGRNAQLAADRQAKAAEALAAARERVEILQPFGVRLASADLPPGRRVLQFDNVTAGYEPGRPVLRGLSFTVTGPERLAVTGPNGSGKTTLLALIAGRHAPDAGAVRRFVPFAMLDQRVSLIDPSLSIRDNFRRLNPDADENACRLALARFMFRADAAMQPAGTLSGGQLLRAGLACVLGGGAPPPLLLLDEPTNHLDIESVETVEAGLRAYDGALVVVSHDEAFLEAIGMTRRLELSPAR
ncbi:ATP-binding cassette domain-containing protein [Rhizobiaceae bacterium BDR2-2]|uniref:ATP-binding cassette domain-containing protein n=1 Tax=Ectorhizobium quercum TaxID=2965071 RepID=A0AAE3N3T4_9HYPH|nr:ABC-F family ATP-binding cassette domain-containing protein [Ectorhizobium quercum]MCX8997997.1 ATP-binding cassette domain-containing protein [Ectorhizobium quercum]